MANGCILKGGITLTKNMKDLVWWGVLIYCLIFWGIVCAVILRIAGV